MPTGDLHVRWNVVTFETPGISPRHLYGFGNTEEDFRVQVFGTPSSTHPAGSDKQGYARREGVRVIAQHVHYANPPYMYFRGVELVSTERLLICWADRFSTP